MKPSTVCLSVVALAIALIAVPSHAQDMGNPSSESCRLGLEGGVTLAAPYEYWTSEHGSPPGFSASLAYDVKLGRGTESQFRLEGLLGVRTLEVEARYPQREIAPIHVSDGSDMEGDTLNARYIPIDYENVQRGTFVYLSLAPSLKYYPVPALYAGAGVDVGVLLKGSTQFTKNIVSKVVQVEGYGSTEVYYPASESADPYSKVFPAKDRDDASKIQVGGVLFAGGEIPLSESLVIGPRVSCMIPFTSVLPTHELRAVTFGVTLGLRYMF